MLQQVADNVNIRIVKTFIHSVFDVDNRLVQIAINAYANSVSNWRVISNIVNDFAKKQKMKERWLSPLVLINTTPDKFERINKILRGK